MHDKFMVSGLLMSWFTCKCWRFLMAPQ